MKAVPILILAGLSSFALADVVETGASPDVAAVRRMAAVDLRAALEWVEPRLAVTDEKDCSSDAINLLLLVGDFYLADSRDGQIERDILPRIENCKSTIHSPYLLSRYYKLAAYSSFNLDEGRDLSRKAESAARESGNYEVLAEALQVKAFILRNLGMLQEASEALQEAIALAESAHDKVLLARMYSDYAYYRARNDDPAAGLQYIEKALALANAEGASRIALSIRLHRALINGGMGKIESAEAELQALLEVTRENRNRSFEAIVLNNLAGMANENKHFDKAAAFSSAAHEVAKRIPSRRLEMNSLANLASSQRGSGQFELAERNYEAALERVRTMNAPAIEARLLKDLGNVYSARGDFRRAYESMSRSSALAESIARKNQAVALSEAQARFDLVQARNDSAILQQQLDWQRERLQQQLFIAVSGGVAALLAIVLLVILVGRHRRVRKLNRRLTDEKQLLAHTSNHDALTGIHNRRYLESRLTQWKRNAESASDAGLTSLILLDLDHFKQINDVHGHATGDQVLVEFAKRIQRVLRDGDVFARWGGDEFCVLARVASTEEAQKMAGRILNEVRSAPFVLGDRIAFVTISVGVATTTAAELNEESWPKIVDSADVALYIAKRMGRNRYICLEFTGIPDDIAMKAMRDDPFLASVRGVMQIHGYTRLVTANAG